MLSPFPLGLPLSHRQRTITKLDTLIAGAEEELIERVKAVRHPHADHRRAVEAGVRPVVDRLTLMHSIRRHLVVVIE